MEKQILQTLMKHDLGPRGITEKHIGTRDYVSPLWFEVPTEDRLYSLYQSKIIRPQHMQVRRTKNQANKDDCWRNVGHVDVLFEQPKKKDSKKSKTIL